MPVIAALDARLAASKNTGDTSYWRGLIRGLAELDSDFQFLLFSNTARPQGIPDAPNLEWIEVSASHPRIWSLSRFPKAAAARGAKVIHTQYNISPFSKIPTITTIHDVSFFIGPEWFLPRDRIMLQRFIPKSCARAEAIITVSETSKADIERHIPVARGKVTAIPNALGDNISPLPIEEAERIVRGQLGVQGPYVLTVGTRWPRKNMMLAVEAMDQLPDRFPHRLILTGKPGWGEEKLGKRSRAVGYVSNAELTALYQCADLYLAPSRHEGFGIPLLEAFACECPVLASSGGALPEVAGGAAMIEESWEASHWADTIAGILADSKKRAELKTLGLSRLQDFDWKKSAEQTLDVYRSVLK